MIEARRNFSAVLAVCLVFGSVDAASARHVRKHQVRVYRHTRIYHAHPVAPIEGSDLGVGLGLVGTGIAGATSAVPCPPGYGCYGPGYDFYGPGYGSPGY